MSTRPHAPTPSDEQAKLIEDLGGPTAVIGFVNDHLGYKPDDPDRLCPQTASMWKKRGIPFAYRACLAIRAREKNIGVPAGFLNEAARADA